MKTIKRKNITFMLVFCLVVLCVMMLFVTQVNQTLTASAQDFSEDVQWGRSDLLIDLKLFN